MQTVSMLVAALVGIVGLVAAQAPELNVITTFPDNPFSLVQNGRQNRVVFSVSQPAGTDQALTLESITGAFLDPNRPDGHRRRVLRNMTTASLKNRPTIRQTGGQPLQIPFDFYSEFKPEKYDVEFRMNVYDQTASKSFNVQAYRGSVTVEEPPFDWFDYQLLSIYALLLACACGAAYWAYTTYISPSNRKSRPAQKRTDTATKPTQAKAPAAEASGSKESASNKTYDEEWIPQHILRPRKPRANK